jgi:glycosyltransferase involved in cell wall biosynthesis
VDDGSDDGSAEFCESISASDSRVKVLRRHNQGAAAARNFGMANASGEYMFFFDADDFAKLNMLERMYNTAEADGADVVVAEFFRYDDSIGAVYDRRKLPSDLVKRKVASGRDVSDRVFRAFKWSPWNKLFRRSFVQKHSLSWQYIPWSNDIVFVNAALAFAERISFLPEAFYVYRQHVESSLSSRREASILSQYEAWTELKKRHQDGECYPGFAEDFKRAAYMGSRLTLNEIVDPIVALRFFNDLNKTIIPELGLHRDVFTDEKSIYYYKILAADIEDCDSPLPFLLRFRKLRDAAARCKLARHKSVEKNLRKEIAHQLRIIEGLREREKCTFEYRFSRFKRKYINAFRRILFKKGAE